MLSLQLIDVIVLVLFAVFVRRTWIHTHRAFPLPRGPKGWPILGNIFDIPKEKPHVAYLEMGHKYESDLIFLNMAGTSLLILNSREAADDLLVERSSLYSNRPDFPMMFLMGWDFNVALLPYGNQWRKSRALLMQQLSSSNLKMLQKPLLQETMYVFLNRLLDTPKDFEDHIHFISGGNILTSVYGIPYDQHGPYLKVIKKAMDAASEVAIPGTYLVDAFPMLRHVPAWFPWAEFKKRTSHERRIVEEMVVKPLAFVKENMTSDMARSCIVSRVLEEMQDHGEWSKENEDLLRMVSATVYTGGADTTLVTIRVIILALVLNPDILKKGQAAVDAVVGPNRLPDFGDEGKIPYVNALVMEGLRWRPVAPLGLPHHTASADIYKGYQIPPNTIVIGNIWAMLHNPATYGEDVAQFRPERFLTPEGTLNSTIPFPDVAFGFGRRVCPGKAFAQSSLWLSVASLLACFNFSKVFDEYGVAIEPSTECIDGIVSQPLPYQCSITSRSTTVEGLIRQNLERHI